MKHFYLSVVIWIVAMLSGTAMRAHEGTHGAPIQFVPNKGQWEAPFMYKGIMPNADIYLEAKGVKYVVGASDNNELVHQFKMGQMADTPLLRFHAYTITWLGANPSPETVGGQPEAHYHNYFLGNDVERWRSEVPVFKTVTYKAVYPGVDFYFYTAHNNLKYDIILAPNANPNVVRLQYDGLEGMQLKKGTLQLRTSVGTVVEAKPYAYQEKDHEQVRVACEYVLDGNVLSFAFPEGYDKSLPLIIDPTIIFASLTGSFADNWGFTATYDAQGNLYAGGIVRGVGYPTTLGAFQATYGGGQLGAAVGTDCDISISKFNAIGSTLVYSTYLGGQNNEMPHSLVVDQNNNLILVGKSNSTNYPVVTGNYDVTHNGEFDIVISKFNNAGTNLLASTYVGGSGDDGVNISANFNVQSDLKHNYGDDARSEVVVDNVGNIYLVGCTRSTNFPTTPNAAKSTLGGAQDGVFLKFNPTLTTMIYGTLLGGSNLDGAYSIALDKTEASVYITGGTSSTDFHASTTVGAYQPNSGGGIDGFIVRIQNSGSYPILRSTYIGTSAYDQIYGVQLDNNNKVYIMGQSRGAFPVFPPGVYNNPGSSQFVMKLDSALSTAIFSTVYGSGPVANVNISPVAFLVDTCENIYISGWGGLTVAGPPTSVVGMPITPATALQATTDGSDFYFIVLKKDLQGLLYGSYFGASVQEHVDGGTSRFDPNGIVYQAMCASCGNANTFPATPGAYASSDNGANCNVGVVKIAFNLGSVSTDAQAQPATTGCAPFTVNFLDNSSNATSWAWDFGDGSTSNAQTPTHTFTTPGVYNVRLIGTNPDACRVADTSWVTITVTDESIHPDFSYNVIDSCNTLSIAITNLSTGIGGGAPTGADFFWDFGNGNTFNGANPPIQVFATGGTYPIKLVMSHPNACNSPDSIIKTVTINPLMVSVGDIPDLSICSGDTVHFAPQSSNAVNFEWDFGDGTSSSLPNPSHAFTSPGTYNVRLIVSNSATCNLFDTVFASVTVRPSPVAQFSVSPAMAEANVPFTFTNQSQGAIAYLWEFGDGNTSSEEHPVHEYNRSGTYQVCLTATNSYNCPARVCKQIDAVVWPGVDVPTGFSPDGNGTNDVFRVRGYGIQSMDLKVFNRWGELVFQSNHPDIGWDGTYKGKPQEMDSYAYTLYVEFVDGTHVKRQGNVTLIR